jgi:hypothetical protein
MGERAVEKNLAEQQSRKTETWQKGGLPVEKILAKERSRHAAREG